MVAGGSFSMIDALPAPISGAREDAKPLGDCSSAG